MIGAKKPLVTVSKEEPGIEDEFDLEGDALLSTFCCDELMSGGSVCDKQTKNISESHCLVPESFLFPFEPYEIQKGFMHELYRCLELGKIGIFESPTGTGKSLSLICGSLRWLKDFQEKQKKKLEVLLQNNTDNKTENNKHDNDELDWIVDFSRKKEKEENLAKIILQQEQAQNRETKMKQLGSRPGKRKRSVLDDEFRELMSGASDDIKAAYNAEMEKLFDNNDCTESDEVDAADKQLLLAEYESDDDIKSESHSDDENEEESVTKIYYCSRTHSQLSQFVREVVKSPYGDDAKVVSLGSRQNLCINEVIKKLKSVSLMNDRCLDLQKKKNEKKEKNSKSGGCPYYKHDSMMDFKLKTLMSVQDIEQLVSMGKKMKACPYYGTRFTVPVAELVALPYNILLHKSTREACKIKLEGNVVIIDEAHNLMETINNVHSVEITGAQVLRAHSQLTQYENRYRSRLKAKNLMYIRQILFFLASFVKCMGGKTDIPSDRQNLGKLESRLWTINDFLFSTGLDNMNLFKVMRYCQRSRISLKLQGFAEKYQVSEMSLSNEKKTAPVKSGLSQFLEGISQPTTNIKEKEMVDSKLETKASSPFEIMTSPLMHIESFLEALTNADKDGRISMNKQGLLSHCSLKFLLLNPAVHFADIVRDARAVIVAGGTMQPVSEFKDQLFHAAGVLPDRILEYSCGHVIPAEQLLPITLSSGPTGIPLDFTYQSRNSGKLLDELGRLLFNVSNVVPGGIVCFFSSYDYKKLVFTHLENSGMISKIATRKKVFQEPRRAGQSDHVLADYTECIEKCNLSSVNTITGAVLFCVVGGKMSEGINFSDDLGRCIIVVGLPYPNIHSPELKEKMDYLNASFPKSPDGRAPGQVHYENLCMKAVNQSIGRAIRHKADYATILLLDQRYSRDSVINKLPGWISECVNKQEKFGAAVAAVSKFFAKK